jgi:hypothetical protein
LRRKKTGYVICSYFEPTLFQYFDQFFARENLLISQERIQFIDKLFIYNLSAWQIKKTPLCREFLSLTPHVSIVNNADLLLLSLG